jgi:hypothetical protein
MLYLVRHSHNIDETYFWGQRDICLIVVRVFHIRADHTVHESHSLVRNTRY